MLGTITCMEALVERFVERFTVRKGILLATLVASVACTRKVVDTTISPATGAATTARLDAPSAGQAGAPTSRAAVEAFLAAVRGQDLRGMSAVWGNEKEPTAAHIKRDELEKRLKQIPKRRQVVAYCRGPFCVYADEAVALLRRKGYKARRLDVGFPDWRAAGLPIGPKGESA